MYNSFTEEARKILICAKEEMKKLKHPYVGSEHLLLAILKDDNEISRKLTDYAWGSGKQTNVIVAYPAVIENQYGEKFQLFGVSTHGLQWFGRYANFDTIASIQENFGNNIIMC